MGDHSIARGARLRTLAFSIFESEVRCLTRRRVSLSSYICFHFHSLSFRWCAEATDAFDALERVDCGGCVACSLRPGRLEKLDIVLAFEGGANKGAGGFGGVCTASADDDGAGAGAGSAAGAGVERRLAPAPATAVPPPPPKISSDDGTPAPVPTAEGVGASKPSSPNTGAAAA